MEAKASPSFKALESKGVYVLLVVRSSSLEMIEIDTQFINEHVSEILPFKWLETVQEGIKQNLSLLWPKAL